MSTRPFEERVPGGEEAFMILGAAWLMQVRKKLRDFDTLLAVSKMTN